MNKIKSIILAVAFIGTSLMAQSGSDTGFSAFAAPGVALNPGTNYAIIPANSRTGGEPLVTYLNVSGLSVNAITLTAYVSTNQTTCVQTNSTTTVYVSNTNGFLAGQIVLIQHLGLSPRFRSEAAVISSLGATNQIVLQTTPLNTVVPGDIINQQTANATIPIATSATAREISGAGIITGQRVEPLLIVVSSAGAGTNTINAANAVYLP